MDQIEPGTKDKVKSLQSLTLIELLKQTTSTTTQEVLLNVIQQNALNNKSNLKFYTPIMHMDALHAMHQSPLIAENLQQFLNHPYRPDVSSEGMCVLGFDRTVQVLCDSLLRLGALISAIKVTVSFSKYTQNFELNLLSQKLNEEFSDINEDDDISFECLFYSADDLLIVVTCHILNVTIL